MRKLFGIVASASLAGAIAYGGAAHATVISYGGTSSSSDGPLSAEADFTTGAGVIDVTLTNNLANDVIRSSGQAISDISFTLGNAPGTQGSLSASGQQGNVSTAGLVTYTTGSPGRFIGVGGGSFTVSGDTITMEALGGGMPSEMIAPAIADGGTYTNANMGFGNFSPYTIGPATFVLDFSGVTADTTITAATFTFGTGPDHTVPGVVCTPGTPPCVVGPPAVPEPGSLALFGSALTGLGIWRRRRKAA